MKLIEALEIIRRCRGVGARFRVFCACSFTPLHFVTFLQAHLAVAMPGKEIDPRTGLYGDLNGSLRVAHGESPDAVVIPLEWPDLDPRLGVRHLGGWEPDRIPEFAAEARVRLAQIRDLVSEIAARTPVVISLPTLPLSPAAFQPPHRLSPFEASLSESLAQFAGDLTGMERVSILNPRELDRISPAAARHDIKSELASGFPYQIAHADALAGLLARLVAPQPARKGLITDLDDTVWRGIVGDDGPDGIAWDMEHHAQIHGFYQQMLRSLAQSGVLVGVASKNDPAILEKVFARPDLLLRQSDLFPVECGWGLKSAAVSRILEVWNIGADSVVFIDDNPMEIDEVQRSHPGMECILFPKNDAAAMYSLAYRLRDLFGKNGIREEDRIRSQSLSAARQLRTAAGTSEDPEAFLRDAGSAVKLTWPEPPVEPRVLELINKTNQFNINGRRYTEAEWDQIIRRSGTSVLLVEYADKYGPLGKIAALVGTRERNQFHIHTWVMSCRAFSRRIEYRTMKEIFDCKGVSEVVVEFQPTERNGPCSGFFAALLGAPPSGPFTLSRDQFVSNCPPLYDKDTGAVPAVETAGVK